MGSVSPYGVGGGHRHTPEMIQNLSEAAGEPVTVSFTPMLAPLSRGILATCSAKARPGVRAETVRAAYEKAFADEPFVHLLPEGQWPATAAVQGSNAVQIQVTHDPAVDRVIAVAALDNLTKGTAGGAVQSMNIALGLPEELGLPTIGVAP
jgi:N-acetyl-gamma-glutamyl-phosphate reductase